jgi:[ribosomal protein S5]-alanine N-acetyltransferase
MNNLKPTDCEITTERLFLRPLREEDVPSIFNVLKNFPEITKFMSFDPPTKEEETRGFFEASQKLFPEKAIRWGIFLNEVFVGTISLEGIERKTRAWIFDVAEMGYWVNPEFHNRGIITEAGKAILRFGFEHVALHKIVIDHVSDNMASQKVIEKLGFRFVGERKDYFFRFGKWWNDKMYEMTIDEFKNK